MVGWVQLDCYSRVISEFSIAARQDGFSVCKTLFTAASLAVSDVFDACLRTNSHSGARDGFGRPAQVRTHLEAALESARQVPRINEFKFK